MDDRRRGARLHRHRDLFRGEVPAWWSGAACRGRTALFYSDDRGDQADAVAVCAGCAVLDQCRSWVFGSARDPVAGGVCAGYTHADRKVLRRKGGTAA